MNTDNDSTRAGWIEAFITDGCTELHVSHAPDADLDGSFLAFCHDEQEVIRVNGWQIAEYELVTAEPDTGANRRAYEAFEDETDDATRLNNCF